MSGVPRFPKLFQSGQIGKLRIGNRIVMLPMGGYFPGINGEVTARSHAYYVERAKGGTGLIIVGVTMVTPPLEPINTWYYFNLSDDRLLPSHYHLTEAVHSYGAKIGIQLSHQGSQMSFADWGDKQPLSPSGIQQFTIGGDPYALPRPMTGNEIYQMIDYFAAAAARAKQAGYDMVEIHGGHGYLVNAFISPATNKRSDEFGGSLENRMRFVVEIVKRIHQLTGDDYPVSVRISADEFIPGGITMEESPAIAEILEEAGTAVISISAGTSASMHTMIDVMRMDEGWKLPIWVAIKKAVTIPTIAGGLIRNPEFGERLIAEGNTDFIGLGRPLLADPYWPQKVKEGRAEDIRKCISCNRCLFALGGGRQIVRHCTVNAMYGREIDFAGSKPAVKKKKVMVVGGGVAGMEAARLTSLAGHEVTLYEKEQEPGGQLLLSSTPPGKEKILWFRDYLITQIKKQGVGIEVGCEVTSDIVDKVKPDAVVIATGARPLVPSIPGIEKAKVTTAWDVLADKPRLADQNIVIIGGGLVGCETAEFLAKYKNKVTIVEMLPIVAQDMEPMNRRSLLDELRECKVIILTNRKVIEVTDNGVIAVNTVTGERQLIEAEQVVLASGSTPVQSLAEELENKVAELYLIGDCRQPRTILEAVSDAFLIGHRISSG